MRRSILATAILFSLASPAWGAGLEYGIQRGNVRCEDRARVLIEDYGFKVTRLLDADRGDIVQALDEYRETLGPKDNLLIYYAGNSWLDDEADRGYWLPADAKLRRRTNRVSNATVTNTLKVLSAKHVMVVADSCYSGTLVRSANVAPRTRAGAGRRGSTRNCGKSFLDEPRTNREPGSQMLNHGEARTARDCALDSRRRQTNILYSFFYMVKTIRRRLEKGCGRTD